MAGYAVGGGHILHMVCDLTVRTSRVPEQWALCKLLSWSCSRMAPAPCGVGTASVSMLCSANLNHLNGLRD